MRPSNMGSVCHICSGHAKGCGCADRAHDLSAGDLAYHGLNSRVSRFRLGVSRKVRQKPVRDVWRRVRSIAEI
jgi:hypothetical protein